MIRLVTNKVSFGHHETFPLRFGWLTKGFRAWYENPSSLTKDDHTVVLGVGKNMVFAIRYWLEAAQLVKTSASQSLTATLEGGLLFSTQTGWDPYLEDDATLWIVHWLIASNSSLATTFFWFFNQYHKPEFTSAELHAALADFVREKLKHRASSTTLKNDIAVLLRMYGPSERVKGLPAEDGLDSPMAALGLIQRTSDGKLFLSRVMERRRLPIVAFAFAVLDLMEAMQLNSIPVERLLRSDGELSSPGAVFRMTEDGLVTKLEELVRWCPGYFELRETAGINQFYQLQSVSKIDMLSKYYNGIAQEFAA